jgi:hypothetical protein
MTGELRDELVNMIVTRVIARFLSLNQTYRGYSSLEAAMEDPHLAAAVNTLSETDGENGLDMSALTEGDWESMRSLLAVVSACAYEVGHLASAIDSMIYSEDPPSQ